MKKWIIGGVIVLAVVLIIIVANGSSSQSTANTGLRIGSPAPNFNLTLSDNKQLLLADMKNKKPLIILATFAGCGPTEGQALTQIQKDYGDKVQIVAVDILDSEPVSALTQYDQENGITIPVAGYDKTMVSAYGLTRPDMTFIINKQGTLVYQDQNITSYATYKQEIGKAL